MITSTLGQGKLGVLNADNWRCWLSGNIQVFLDTVRLFLIRHVVRASQLQCTLSFINGDGIYFYASSNLANELAQVLPEGVAFTHIILVDQHVKKLLLDTRKNGNYKGGGAMFTSLC